MNALPSNTKIAVIGAGTMGAGIAQVAAAAGHSVMLIDIAEGIADKGKQGIRIGLDRLVSRAKMSQDQVNDLLSRITPEKNIEQVRGCALVIEAIVENLGIKQKLLDQLEALTDDTTIIASNTSSISISALAAKSQRPENIVGMHFFNPAAILKLVEVVSGLQTSSEVAETVFQTALAWGKKPVHAKSTPGFIVNRVARPFYAEALRSLNEQMASVATIDALMRSCGGFKMGPLELTDLIGQDINCAVTESVYNAFFQDKRFMPSVLQADMVAAGLLGRKSGKGFYDYESTQAEVKPHAEADLTSGSTASSTTLDSTANSVTVIGDLGPVKGLRSLLTSSKFAIREMHEGHPRIEVGNAIIQLTDGRTATQRSADQGTPNLVLFDYAVDYQATDLIAICVATQASEDAKHDAIRFFQKLGKQVCVIKDVPGMQVLRTVSMLINEAYDTVNQGVCTADAVDQAMQSGVAYPQGPFAWAGAIGLDKLVFALGNIQQAYGEERYRVSPLLKTQQYA